jgi:hypothetical protein
MKKIDPVQALREALQVLSPSEIEKAWAAGEAANKALGNPVLRAELVGYLLARILDDLGKTTKRDDDLGDVLPSVEALAMYCIARSAVIVSELGRGQGKT